jgi:SAM-dependent methyltransferase
MGLNYYVARDVLRARQACSSPFSVASIGRLQQFLLPKQCERLCDEFDLDETATWLRQPFGEYGEPLFKAMGAEEIISIDASGYEGASITHDMNLPVPSELCERFDIVIDGGTLEHVFAPSVALASMMRMVKVGGSLIIWTPANNLCGHGFYQFSPEFFYSALSDDRGFDLRHVLLVECVFPSVSLVAPRRAFQVRSPQELRRRVEVRSKRPLMSLAHAVKTSHLDDPFARPPQQSDYVAAWQAQSDAAHWGNGVLGRVRGTTLQILRGSERGRATARWLQGMNELRVNSLRNRKSFTRE